MHACMHDSRGVIRVQIVREPHTWYHHRIYSLALLHACTTQQPSRAGPWFYEDTLIALATHTWCHHRIYRVNNKTSPTHRVQSANEKQTTTPTPTHLDIPHKLLQQARPPLRLLLRRLRPRALHLHLPPPRLVLGRLGRAFRLQGRGGRGGLGGRVGGGRGKIGRSTT